MKSHKLALITEDNCLVSMSAVHWAKDQTLDIEVVSLNEVPDVAEIYDVERCPTLLSIGEYGLFTKITGYNKRLYDELINEIYTKGDAVNEKS